LDAVAREIHVAGGTALAMTGDVSVAEDCERVVNETIARFGRVDALVNNAGVLEPIATFADANPQAWERNLAVNLFGAVNMTGAVLPHLRASGGRVIHVSSGAALEPYHGFSAYCVSKAALNHFSRALAIEEPQLTSIALRPGKVDTEMQELLRRKGAEGMEPEQYERHVRLHSRGDLLPPQEPGRSLALLALCAPRQWSGEFLQWDDPRIRSLV
jgi:NAD(P)-dependent dehydrogenase (short-subunit alcohol dehydrogenase family)